MKGLYKNEFTVKALYSSATVISSSTMRRMAAVLDDSMKSKYSSISYALEIFGFEIG